MGLLCPGSSTQLLEKVPLLIAPQIPEVMHALNDMVQQGKVLYLGISDTPAWIVAKANEYARGHNLRPFVLYQGKWNVAYRDMEREILPMCRSEGMGIAPWGALGMGHFKTVSITLVKECMFP